MLRLLLLYQFWQPKISIHHKPHPTRYNMHDLEIALPKTLMFPFSFSSSTPYARHICPCFELWGRPFHLSLFASFFPPSFLPSGLTMKGTHSTQLRCHILFLSFFQLTTCFFIQLGRLLDSCKRQLFLHIQHVTHCLFEWRNPVSSSEAAFCRFCFLILPHTTNQSVIVIGNGLCLNPGWGCL